MQMVLQRDQMDCGVAALAMALGVPYEVSLQHCRSVKKRCVREGMMIKDLQLAAQRMGRKMKRTGKKTNRIWPREVAGVLSLRRGKAWHYVGYFDGQIFDPYHGTVDSPAKFKAAGWSLCTLLEVLPS